MSQRLWTPSTQRVETANLTAFKNVVEAQTGRTFTDYRALHDWSVEDIRTFWSTYATYACLPFKTTAAEIVSEDPMPYTHWFEGATLNYAEALLYPPDLSDDQQPAILAVTESGHQTVLSYSALRREVARAQSALRRSGFTRGDRVAVYAANIPETVILLLACASIGVIFSSCSPDFGFDAARARFEQIEPKMLFASGAYWYQGRRFDTLPTLERLRQHLKSLECTVLLPYPGEEPASSSSSFTGWSEWMDEGEIGDPVFSMLPFDHPLYILYSSGTTGLPKPLVHRAGGALIKHHVEQHVHSDIRAGDRVLYFTTCGWMMWNWLVSVLAQSATIVLYEGSPSYPTLETLWHLAERLDLSFFGTSARYIHTLIAQELSPQAFVDLSSLRTLASTGSPLSPQGFQFVFDHIKRDLHLASISGGTDIVGCFVAGVPTEPVYEGEIQGSVLGADVAAFDIRGEKVIGEAGELVCLQPLPSMPIMFWGDRDFDRYHSAYFDTYPDVWRHGDLVEINERGGVVIYGRSDATLNPGGVRIGTSEIYRPLESFVEVVESVAIGKKLGGDEEIWLFVVLREGEVLTQELRVRIEREIRTQESPRHVPKRVVQVIDLPRTRSGKLMEIAVSRVANGLPIPNREVIENPESIADIERTIAAMDR